MSGQRKSPLWGRASGLIWLALLGMRFDAIANTVNGVVPDELGLSGIHVANKLIDVLRVHLSIMRPKRDTLLVHINNMGESNFLFIPMPSVDDVREVRTSLDLLISNHFVAPVVGLFRSYVYSINQMFGIVNKQFEAI